MTTKVNFIGTSETLVPVASIPVGAGFRWQNMLYIKLQNQRMVRIKGDSRFDDFETTDLGGNTKVERLNLEINFSLK